jgi:outer membrane protein OmpA-like peptidoglycan-associated protein
VRVKSLVALLVVASALLLPALASAGAYSGTNGWISYVQQIGMAKNVKGVKPDASTVVFNVILNNTPSWSADGSKVAWNQVNGQNSQIKVASPTGSGLITVATGPFDSSAVPSISSDGTKIAIGHDCDIFLVDAAASQSLNASTKVVDGAMGGTCASNPSLSSTGAIAYARGGSNCALYIDVWVLASPTPGTPNFGSELTATCDNNPGFSGVRGGPTWSPDASKIIYAANINAVGGTINSVLPNNTGKQNLYTTGSSSVTVGPTPVYSPDGTKIAFAEGAQYGACCTVKYMNADGTSATSTSGTADSPSAVTWGPNVDLSGGGSNSGGGSSSSSSSSTATASTTSTGKPAPGPALKVTDIPAEITLDLGSSTGGTIPADQPIVAEVPCTAPEGQLLDRCTVNVTAPEYVLLGQGDGISVRADKKVSIGKATVKAKAGKKVIVVKVKINPKGRKALQRNLKITATVGLTAITVSNLKSTGEANTEMRLPTQLISPESGIFDSNSVSLNKTGVAFVNRLAALLPKKPKNMVFIGFADNTGVPGDNRWLGDRRAKAVRDALAAKGIEPVKSSIETKAATSPRADNSKASGRERNRRVSIRITY